MAGVPLFLRGPLGLSGQAVPSHVESGASVPLFLRAAAKEPPRSLSQTLDPDTLSARELADEIARIRAALDEAGQSIPEQDVLMAALARLNKRASELLASSVPDPAAGELESVSTRDAGELESVSTRDADELEEPSVELGLDVTVTVTVVDRNDLSEKRIVGDLMFVGQFRWDAEVSSVRDLVDKVKRIAGGNKISRLNIHGHGAPGLQATGEGATKSEPGGHLSHLNVRRHAAVLRELTGLFTPDAVVVLHGCCVGQGEPGSRLLSELAAIWGVDVLAGTGAQVDELEGLEGAFKRCAPPQGNQRQCSVDKGSVLSRAWNWLADKAP
jgi:hypothetical protein